MPYSMAQASFDEAVALYERGQFQSALIKLHLALRICPGTDAVLEKNIRRYMGKCLAELKH